MDVKNNRQANRWVDGWTDTMTDRWRNTWKDEGMEKQGETHYKCAVLNNDMISCKEFIY